MRKTIRMQELHWGNLLFIWTRYEHSFRPHAWCPPVCLSPFPVAVFSIFCFLLLSDDCEELVQVRQDRVKMERKYGTPQKTVLDSWFTNPVQPAGIFIELHYKDKFNVRTDEPRFVLFFANIHPIHFDGTPPAGQGVKSEVARGMGAMAYTALLRLGGSGGRVTPQFGNGLWMLALTCLLALWLELSQKPSSFRRSCMATWLTLTMTRGFLACSMLSCSFWIQKMMPLTKK